MPHGYGPYSKTIGSQLWTLLKDHWFTAMDPTQSLIAFIYLVNDASQPWATGAVTRLLRAMHSDYSDGWEIQRRLGAMGGSLCWWDMLRSPAGFACIGVASPAEAEGMPGAAEACCVAVAAAASTEAWGNAGCRLGLDRVHRTGKIWRNTGPR